MSVYLNSQPKSEMDLIHTAAYIRCQLIHRLREKGMLHFFLHRESISHSNLISSDQYPNNDPHAPYSQFIFLSMREDGKQDVGDKDTILQTIARYRIAEGGYANRAGGPSATTNATVAALAVQGQLAGYTINADMACLQQMQDTSGGFRATTESPVPDLLSTATALFILKCYGVVPRYVTDDFIDAHWLDSGGFAATLLDDMSDVEYTFYGLLALGTL